MDGKAETKGGIPDDVVTADVPVETGASQTATGTTLQDSRRSSSRARRSVFATSSVHASAQVSWVVLAGVWRVTLACPVGATVQSYAHTTCASTTLLQLPVQSPADDASGDAKHGPNAAERGVELAELRRTRKEAREAEEQAFGGNSVRLLAVVRRRDWAVIGSYTSFAGEAACACCTEAEARAVRLEQLAEALRSLRVRRSLCMCSRNQPVAVVFRSDRYPRFAVHLMATPSLTEKAAAQAQRTAIAKSTSLRRHNPGSDAITEAAAREAAAAAGSALVFAAVTLVDYPPEVVHCLDYGLLPGMTPCLLDDNRCTLTPCHVVCHLLPLDQLWCNCSSSPRTAAQRGRRVAPVSLAQA